MLRVPPLLSRPCFLRESRRGYTLAAYPQYGRDQPWSGHPLTPTTRHRLFPCGFHKDGARLPAHRFQTASARNFLLPNCRLLFRCLMPATADCSASHDLLELLNRPPHDTLAPHRCGSCILLLRIVLACFASSMDMPNFFQAVVD